MEGVAVMTYEHAYIASIKKKTDEVLAQYGIPVTCAGYFYIRELLLYICLNGFEGSGLQTSGIALAKELNVRYDTMYHTMDRCVKRYVSTPPQSICSANEKLTLKKFILFCLHEIKP